MQTIEDISAARLNARLREGGLPLLLYVWAPWCPPCKTMTPAFEDFARQSGDSIEAVKLNAASESQLLSSLRIASVPMLILFDQDGREIARRLGALSSEQMRDLVETVLARP